MTDSSGSDPASTGKCIVPSDQRNSDQPGRFPAQLDRELTILTSIP